MTDFENDLRELFREKAAEAPLATPALPAAAPREILRRGRRRQVGTVLGSAALIVALLVGSVAGLTRILGEGRDDRDIGDGGYKVFERTATIEAFTVSGPSDWTLVNEWPLSLTTPVEVGSSAGAPCVAAPIGEPVEECNDTGEATSSSIPQPYGLPMLQLSNVDMGLDRIACRDGLPSGAAVLYIGVDPNNDLAPEGAPMEPYPIGPGLPSPADGGPCGPGTYAHFTVNGMPMFFWIGLGDGASDEDRATVERTAEMMSADDAWEPAPPTETGPGYVIAGGTDATGEDWRLELRPSQENVAFSLVGQARSSDFVIPPSVIELVAADPIFGAITTQAAAIEFRSKDDPSVAIEGTIVPLPPSMPFDFDLFFIEGTAGIDGEAVALGPDGEVIEGDTSVGTLRRAVVQLDGSLLGHDWSARFTGAFAGRSACIDVRIDGKQDQTGPNCRKITRTSWAGAYPALDAWVFDQMYIGAGSVPSAIVGLRFRSDDPTRGVVSGLCESGPTGWTDHNVCAIALPPENSGTFEYLDGGNAVVSRESASWGTADPSGTPLQPVAPVHGGTYWAVYPWVGAPGSPEADDVSARLLEVFGIEAFPGDLSCDDGAAEALGTDAPQGIGVYFETEDEANEFALQAGLLDHTNPVIAHVTTYCLD